MTRKEFMEKAEVVQEYFDKLLQKDIAETMHQFNNEQYAKGGIFESLLIEAVVKAKMQDITLEMLQEMLKVTYEDVELIRVSKDYQ